jgi:hypothetical protein
MKHSRPTFGQMKSRGWTAPGERKASANILYRYLTPEPTGGTTRYRRLGQAPASCHVLDEFWVFPWA